jgi:hypothetical protein
MSHLATAANAVAPSVKIVTPVHLQRWLNGSFIAAFSLGFWHMIAVTLFGLYQLSDRMHQPDQG